MKTVSKKSLILVALVVILAVVALADWRNAGHLILGTLGDTGIARVGVAQVGMTNGGDSVNGGSVVTTKVLQYAAAGDLAGTKTLSGGAGTVTFAAAYTAAPVCACTDQTAANAVKCSTSTSALTIAGTTTDVIAYVCIGNPN